MLFAFVWISSCFFLLWSRKNRYQLHIYTEWKLLYLNHQHFSMNDIVVGDGLFESLSATCYRETIRELNDPMWMRIQLNLSRSSKESAIEEIFSRMYNWRVTRSCAFCFSCSTGDFFFVRRNQRYWNVRVEFFWEMRLGWFSRLIWCSCACVCRSIASGAHDFCCSSCITNGSAYFLIFSPEKITGDWCEASSRDHCGNFRYLRTRFDSFAQIILQFHFPAVLTNTIEHISWRSEWNTAKINVNYVF